MRFHVLGCPYTKTHRDYNWCAFTQKIYHFCWMMHSLGHEVFHYGAEGSDVPCTEHITTITDAEQRAFFGPPDFSQTPAIDWSPNQPYWQQTNMRMHTAIRGRKQPKDFVITFQGTSQQPVAEYLPDLMMVEGGIGYVSTFAKYRVFESYAHMHTTYGRTLVAAGRDIDGSYYDDVIPAYCDLNDFHLAPKKDYYLYVGRTVRRKGIGIAVDTCNALGAKLLLAGQGVKSCKDGVLTCVDGGVYKGNLEYVGAVNVEQRAQLMAEARALFAPTIYVEPYGAVAVESCLSGSPAITTDWGGFTESIVNGVNGFRCHTLKEFVAAAEKAKAMNPQAIHDFTAPLHDREVLRHRYQTYFERLLDLWDRGWYSL